MDMQDRQYIGILASDEESDGRHNVFINKGSYIQYKVKSLLLPQESPNFVSGFINSFEDDSEIGDDEYSAENERIENFREAVKDKLFIYSYKVNEGGHANLLSRKTNLVQKPLRFSDNTYFYAIPVFCSKYNEVTCEWAEEKDWRLFREYETKEEFIDFLKNKKGVGSTYGYYTDAFMPSFVIWMDEKGDMYAIGHIIDNRQNAKGGLIFESDKIAVVNINEYEEYWVYQGSLNPTIMYMPEDIYAKVEDSLLKLTTLEDEKENSENEVAAEEDGTDRMSVAVEEKNQSDEKLIEIDTSNKTDELIIQCMDYHSQKHNLFYNMKDFVNFHTAVKCNSLVILSGLSGTGKSAMVDIYARALGMSNTTEPDQNRMLFIPVRPSWNDDSDLLGYVDLVHMVYRASDSGFVDFLVRSQKNDNKDKLFIVCFDEMNLAQIEYYFAPFLANLERNEKYITLYAKDATCLNEYPYKIPLYDNLLIVGTINKDETTKELSERLLDRIYLLNLNESDFTSYRNEQLIYRNVVRHYNYKLEDYMKSLPLENPMYELDTNELKLLDSLNALFNNESMLFRISYRNLSNICLFLLLGNNFDREFILDKALEEVVFSKICGPSLYLKDIISKVKEVLNNYLNLSNFSNSLALLRIKQSELDKYGYTR